MAKKDGRSPFSDVERSWPRQAHRSEPPRSVSALFAGPRISRSCRLKRKWLLKVYFKSAIGYNKNND